MKKNCKKIAAFILAFPILICIFTTSLFAVETVENIFTVADTNGYFEADEIIPNPNYISETVQTSATTSSRLSSGVYRLKNVYNNKYLDTNNGGVTAGTKLVQWDYSPYINGDVDVPNRNQLFKITYMTSSNGVDYYNIRPMTNNGMGVSAPKTTTTNLVDIQGMSVYDTTGIFNFQKWIIASDGNYYTLKNTFARDAYLSTPTDSTNGSQIMMETTLTDRSRWILEPFTESLDGVIMTNYDDVIDNGSTFYYQAVMYSSTIGRNGPVTYSVSDMDNNPTDLATIGETLGYFRALAPGAVRVKVTYENAPWIWAWNIKIIFPVSGSEITYNPALWNYSPVQEYANCYSYMLNNQVYPGTNTLWYLPQPGIASGHYLTQNDISQEVVISYVEDDAEELNFTFEEIDKNTKCSGGSYKVALVIAPGCDYHWYRQNPDGTWSHKSGQLAVTDIDASDNIIYDPETADRNYSYANYTVFAGYFKVTPLNNFYSNTASANIQNLAVYDEILLEESKQNLPTIDSAKKIGRHMTYSEVTQIMGAPQRILTFGLIVVEYDLEEGKSLIVEYVNRNGHYEVESCIIQ